MSDCYRTFCDGEDENGIFGILIIVKLEPILIFGSTANAVLKQVNILRKQHCTVMLKERSP